MGIAWAAVKARAAASSARGREGGVGDDGEHLRAEGVVGGVGEEGGVGAAGVGDEDGAEIGEDAVEVGGFCFERVREHVDL